MPEIWWESGHQGQGRASLWEGELSLAGDTQKVRGVLGTVTTEAWSWARESGLNPKAKGHGRFLCWEGWATRGCVGESVLANGTKWTRQCNRKAAIMSLYCTLWRVIEGACGLSQPAARLVAGKDLKSALLYSLFRKLSPSLTLSLCNFWCFKLADYLECQLCKTWHRSSPIPSNS